MKNQLTRRLAAIMFTDMVGFTALMQRDEKLGLQKRERHRSVIEQQHKNYRGEIIQYFGDGTLSIFSNSCDAVECAVEIQKALRTPIEVPLRIGIHVGNVLMEKDGIIGDAVNIASRIESFANVGGVLLSDVVQDQVKNQAQLDFVSLGKFTLKNVERPFEIFAVSTPGVVVPEPNFLHGKGEKIANFKTNIPIPATPILGREDEIATLMRLLKHHQLVTITGAGGMGKTRLSLEVCHRLKSEFKDGLAFVSMVALTDATQVMPTLATALDIKEAKGRDLVNGIAAIISDKKALLVLDNFEQVISAAQQIADLISKCPNLTILCTSRAPLRIKAEKEFPLHPLSLPEKNASLSPVPLLEYPAIELFVARAQQVNMDFELTTANAQAVAEICQRVDGLPLAIELAAARIRILPPEQLLKRLGRALDILTSGSKDLPERHQTLRATIEWSHSLLNEAERRLFRRMAVFAGGFTLEAIEAVCYDDEDSAFQAIDELESLVEKGLVENLDGGKRFSMLQTINDFAMEKLEAAAEEDRYFQKHAAYFSEIAKKTHRGTLGEQQLARMKQGALEEANTQAALDYLLSKAREGDEDAKEMGLSICGELWMYWHMRGKHISAKNYVNSFFDATKDLTPTIGKSKALLTLSLAYWTLGDYEKSLEAAKLHHSIALQLNDELELGKAALNIVMPSLFLDLDNAKIYAEESITRFRKLKDDYWLSGILWFSGIVNLITGDPKASKEHLTEALDLIEKAGDNEIKGGILSALALLEVIAGNPEMAIELYQQSLAAYQACGDRLEEARILNEMSWVYLAVKNTIAAKKYTLLSIQAYQEVGSIRGIGVSMICLAGIEAVEGRPREALEIAAAAECFAEQEGIVNVYGDNDEGKVYLEMAKKELSDFEIEQAANLGKTLSVKEVLELAENDVLKVD